MAKVLRHTISSDDCVIVDSYRKRCDLYLESFRKIPDTGSIWIALIIVVIYYLFNLVLRYARLNQMGTATLLFTQS